VSDHEVGERSTIVQRPLVPHKIYGELPFPQSLSHPVPWNEN